MRASYLGVFLLFFVGFLAEAGQAEVRLVGTVSYETTGSNIRINVDEIENTSNSRTTGTLYIGLWMTEGPSPAGNGWMAAEISLFGVVQGASDGRLRPRSSFLNLQVSGEFTRPPPSTYYVHLVVMEFPNLRTYLDFRTLAPTVSIPDSGVGNGTNTSPPARQPPPPPSGSPSESLGCPTCGGFTLSNARSLFDSARRTMEVSVWIGNDRPSGASGSLQLEVWLSSERDFGGDLHIASSVQSPIQVGRLAGGSTLDFRSGWVPYFPPRASGSYYVYYILREFTIDGFENRAIIPLGPRNLTGTDAVPDAGGGGGGGSLNIGFLVSVFLLIFIRLGLLIRKG